MSSAVLMERAGMTMPGVGMPSYGYGYGYPAPAVPTPTTVPVGTNWMMVPRCTTLKFEKCTGGFKVTCVCEDKVAASMLQNLCAMLQGGVFSCCCVLNGMPVCYYNFTYCMWKYETTENGVYFTCTSGDPQFQAMLQSCCDCLCSMVQAGCSPYVLVNNTPVCCAAYECATTGGKSKK